MIIVVEGPSAAGKTTWARTHAAAVLVPEAAPSADPPGDPGLAARFWVEIGASRWSEAVTTERTQGTAVCDTDPLKLHYAWSMCRIGAISISDLAEQVAAYRSSVVAGRLGFADHYLVAIPDTETLDSRKTGDGSRRRRNFDMHRQLGGPLREWYAGVDAARPGSVTWGFPIGGVSDLPVTSRPRYDVAAFDAIVARLGELLQRGT